MTRALWSGNLSLALINIPVKLHKANRDATVHFHNMHAACNTPINTKRFCMKCNIEVVQEELNKGFEVGKDQYVVITESELAAAANEESRVIRLDKVIDAAEILPVACDTYYYLAPDKNAEHAYSLLAKALSDRKRALIGKFIMRSKEHLAAVQYYNGGLMLATLHWNDELYDIKPLIESKLEPIPEQELMLAGMLLDKMHAAFNHGGYHDTYRERVTAMIHKKLKGETITVSEIKAEPAPTDMFAELKRSLEMMA